MCKTCTPTCGCPKPALTLEVGKTYKTRAGTLRKVVEISKNRALVVDTLNLSNHGLRYLDGRKSTFGNNTVDLVEEYIPPVVKYRNVYIGGAGYDLKDTPEAAYNGCRTAGGFGSGYLGCLVETTEADGTMTRAYLQPNELKKLAGY